MRKIICLIVFVFWAGMLWSQEVWENKTYIYDGFADDYFNPGLQFRFSKQMKNKSDNNNWLENKNFRLEIGRNLPMNHIDYLVTKSWGDYGQAIEKVQIGDYSIVKDQLYTYVLAHGTQYLVLASKKGEVVLLIDTKTGEHYWGAEENSRYCVFSAYSTRIPTINSFDYFSSKVSSYLSETLDGVTQNYDGRQEDITGKPYHGFTYTILHPWIEGVKGDGIGEWEAIPIKGSRAGPNVDLVIFNGYIKPDFPEYYYSNNRVKELMVTAGKQKMNICLSDSPNPQIIHLPKSFVGNEVRFTIKSVYKGKKYDDTALANIALFYYNQE